MVCCASASIDTPAAMQQKQLAQVGVAACMAETGNHAQGIQIVDGLIAKNNPEQDRILFGRAYNALGRCHMQSGNTKEALMAYLHTHILFYSEPDTHAEALYYLSQLWNDASIKKADRAVSARSLLRERYAGSSWAKKN